MQQLTKEQAKGIRFELWLYNLLKTIPGIYNVLKNVEYHKERFVFRQVDISYQIITPKGLELVLVEAKYSSNGPIKYYLREPKKKAGQTIRTITTLVDEIKEREYFVGAQKSVLITNTIFEKELERASQANNIYLINHQGLEKLLGHQQKPHTSLQTNILQTRLTKDSLKKHLIYLT